jgi:hypothetical protein
MIIPTVGQPEDRARANIDRLLTDAAWISVDKKQQP